MKTTKTLTSLFCIFFVASSMSDVFQIDTSEYFAYYKLPDKFTGSVSVYKPYIFLSKKRCLASGVENENAMQAISYYPDSGRISNDCWARYSEIVTVCPVGADKTSKLGNACVDIDVNNFLDTSSLPKSAAF